MKKVTSDKLCVTRYTLTVLWSYGLMVFLTFSFLPSPLFAQTKADTIHVSHYDINLEIRNLPKKEIKGYTDLEIVAKIAPLSYINLDLQGLTVDLVKNGNNSIGFSHTGHVLKIELPFSSAGEVKNLRVYYHGKPKQDSQQQWGGFIFEGSYAYNMGVTMASLPHSYGRVWYPCMDEFTDKSTYTFNILTDLDKKAVCGGMLTDSLNLDTAMLWKWELIHPIPTYLASVAVGPYKAYKDTFHSVSGEVLPIEIYADSTTLKYVPESFVNLKSFIHTYENRWGACRWQKVGYVAVPFRSGAMEHATNIAYPRTYITGTTVNEDLIAHELAHFWFGNLITCSNSHNMWINEGFATYGALLCDEALDIEAYKAGIRGMHSSALSRARFDNFGLDNVPTSATYGTSSYQKGGLVAYTLRYYMGDDLYFSSIKQFLDNNEYANISSVEFFNQMSQISGMDLTDFYLGWVHQPGFLNFNIDSVKPKDEGENIYQVFFKQRLHYAEYFANNNILDVEFVSASGERYLAERVKFSGENEVVEVEIPFLPLFWAIDPHGKLGTACIGYTQEISKTGNFTLGNAGISIQVNEINDTAILRVEHNLVPPAEAQHLDSAILRISNKHFWRVGFLQYNNIDAEYKFSYTPTYDGELLKGYTKNHLILLYRKDNTQDWQIIPSTVSGGDDSGKISAKEILTGEYTLGIGEYLNIKELENSFEVYPNPTNGKLKIKVAGQARNDVQSVEIFDVYGRMQQSRKAEKQKGEWVLDISNLSNGTYFVKTTTETGTIIKKIIKQ